MTFDISDPAYDGIVGCAMFMTSFGILDGNDVWDALAWHAHPWRCCRRRPAASDFDGHFKSSNAFTS